MRTIPEHREIMRSAFNDDLDNTDDRDSPTEPMIPIILAPRSPVPPQGDSAGNGVAAEPTLPLRTANPLSPMPETPLNHAVLPPPSQANPDGALHTVLPGSNDVPVLPASPAEAVAPVLPGRSPVPTVIGVCFLAVQVILLVRVLLLLFNAKSSAIWVHAFYIFSSAFALPFRLLLDHIQPLAKFGPDVINYVAPLVAILIYGLISRILVRFLKALLN